MENIVPYLLGSSPRTDNMWLDVEKMNTNNRLIRNDIAECLLQMEQAIQEANCARYRSMMQDVYSLMETAHSMLRNIEYLDFTTYSYWFETCRDYALSTLEEKGSMNKDELKTMVKERFMREDDEMEMFVKVLMLDSRIDVERDTLRFIKERGSNSNSHR